VHGPREKTGAALTCPGIATLRMWTERLTQGPRYTAIPVAASGCRTTGVPYEMATLIESPQEIIYRANRKANSYGSAGCVAD